MGLMTKLFGKHQESTAEAQPDAAATATCPHTTMTPRWDRAEDIGYHDRVSGYRCEGCGTMFSREEAEQLRSSESERLRETVPTE